jgi:hypothetical protein
VVVFMFALIGMSAAAIDVGYWYHEKRQAQSLVDAAALAGASDLPAGWTFANAAATAEANNNKKPGDAVSITNTTYGTANDSVTVAVTREAPSFFAKIFGIDSATIQAQARATVRTPSVVVPKFNVMPWAVPRDSFVPGNPYPVYTDNRNNANNGAVSLPYVSGPNCPTPNGANPYRDEIAGDLNPCAISVGQVIDLKTGNNTGPTSQGLNDRIPVWKTFSEIVTPVGNGEYQVLDSTTGQLVMIPIVENLSGGTSWPNGSGQMRVVGFAWFVIESCGPVDNPSYCKNSDGGQVNGRFVRLGDASEQNTLGNYNGTNSTAYQVVLSL